MSTPEKFELTGPLPDQGVTILEASAGTGKTYAIAALATRFIAEGFPIESLLIVTFSRAAAGELKSRVHQRLASTLSSLVSFSSIGKQPEDEIDKALAEGDVESICERLNTALGKIDEATIATIHEYSSRMIAELGVLVDHDDSSTFVDDMSELIEDVVADTYLSSWDHKAKGDWKRAQTIGKEVCFKPSFKIIPSDTEEGIFAHKVRSEFDRRKRSMRIYGYDDMVDRLTDALDDPETGNMAARVLSKRFPIVMVDEFQDTDPQQWRIIEKAFAKHCRVILIGDPKQAIYGFRGGDVETYQKAKSQKDGVPVSIRTMSVNYRSDPGVADGVLELFGSANLGVDSSPIQLPPVSANRKSNRIFRSSERLDKPVLVRRIPGSRLSASDSREAIDRDVIAQIYDLVENYELESNDSLRPIKLNDIAVLVRRNKRGEQILSSLQEAGIPATFSGSDSVYASTAAYEWNTLLTALATQRTQDMTRATLTSFFGLTSVELANNETSRTRAFMLMREYANLMDEFGPIAVLEKIVEESDFYSSLLAEPSGRRQVTDFQHVAELLDEAARKHHLGSAGLSAWLSEQITKSKEQSDEITRRLETDRPTVTLTTIHQAKGLEFPIVLLPEASEYYWSGKPQPGRLSTGHWNGERVIDLDFGSERSSSYFEEELAESLRLFYVSATRAASFLVCWYSSTKTNTLKSPLHRLLYELSPGTDRKHVLFCDSFTSAPPKRVLFDQAEGTQKSLHVNQFTRVIDNSFRRTSYSGLTAEIHGVPLLEDVDEPLEEVANAESAMHEKTDKPISALAGLPGGVNFGTLVHSILEKNDPAAKDLKADLLEKSSTALNRLPIEGVDADTLAAGLSEVVTTGLGDLTEGFSLRDIGAKNRLAELEFEMSMGSERGYSTLKQLAGLFDDESLADPRGVLVGYGKQLAATSAASSTLHGFLTGSIDAVLKVKDAFAVVDYKTNRIALQGDEVLTADKYDSAGMEKIMRESHYPLQALIYMVALHRFLSWRLPSYDPAKHLRGAGYLFVRGMVGQSSTESDMHYGVFTWRPNPEIAVRASEIISGAQL